MKVYLVDGTYELFRAFFGAPKERDEQGREVGATRALARSLRSMRNDPEATHVAVAFDHVIESFRNQLYAGYKTGEGVDPELMAQFPWAEDVTRELGMIVWPMVEFEADDALAAGAARFAADPRVDQVRICSPDKDLAQCVGPKVRLWDRRAGTGLDEAGVIAKFGVPPAVIPDYLALVGDSADGYPGIPKWGAKSAAALLAQYGSIAAIPDDPRTWSIKVRGAEALAQSLAGRREEAALYRTLATLRTDVPLTESLDDLRWSDMSTVLLTRSDVAKLVAMPEVIAAVEGAFAAHGRGLAQMPPKVYLDLPAHGGDFRAMPAYLPADGDCPARAGVKWVNSHPENPRRHALPSVMGAYLLSDPDTALPLVLMDATLLTALRTGAAGAVATRHLGPAEPRTIGFVGCGAQADVLWQAHRVLWPELVILAADLDPSAAARFVKTHGGRVATLVEAAGADVVCTSTPVRAPVVKEEWVKPGAHVNAMGADAPGKQELEGSLVAAARVFVDDPHQAHHSGEVNVPLAQGTLAESAIAGTLGEVVSGAKRGRLSGRDITIFDSTGLAIQDLAVARVVEAEARRRGIGRAVELLE